MFLEQIPYLFLFLQLIAGEVVFLVRAPRRSLFPLRMAVSVAAAGTASYFLRFMPYIDIGVYFITLALSICVIFASYKISLLHAGIFSVVAYALQNCAFNIALIVFELAGVRDMNLVRLVSLGVLAALLVACWFLFVRDMSIDLVLGLKNVKLVAICIVVLALVIVLHAKFNRGTAEIIGRVFLILCVCISLFLLFGISARERLSQEKAQIEEMLRREETLHRISKENIDIINMKCHDLKHRIAALRAGGNAVADDDFKEIEEAVALYDGFVKTGNSDLDIVIAEKNLRCRESGIVMSCMIDGARLSFMRPGDIYSLFGNALDNAIEHLEKVDDKEKRIVGITVQARGNFIGVRVENYCARRLKFVDGLPVTDKDDKNYHGFGMKSMRYIVEKYGGALFAEQRGDSFVLNIMFPAHSSAAV